MSPQDCRFHGKHDMELRVVEVCKGCGEQRDRGRTSCLAIGCMPVTCLIIGLALGIML